jgi:hypothetical protein
MRIEPVSTRMAFVWTDNEYRALTVVGPHAFNDTQAVITLSAAPE